MRRNIFIVAGVVLILMSICAACSISKLETQPKEVTNKGVLDSSRTAQTVSQSPQKSEQTQNNSDNTGKNNSSTTYDSTDYSYSISYPEEWVMQKLPPKSVFKEGLVIYPSANESAVVMVFVWEKSSPIETSIRTALETDKKNSKNLNLLVSKQISDWDWYLDYNCVSMHPEIDTTDTMYRHKIYFKKTALYEYWIQFQSHESVFAIYPFDQIVKSFKLTN